MFGEIASSLDDCKLCQMVSSGLLQVNLICTGDILCMDSRAQYILLKCPRAYGSYIADNLVMEDF